MRFFSPLPAVLLLAAACNGSGSTDPTGGSTGSPADALPLPEHGTQIASTDVSLDPGVEKYMCWSVKLPDDAPLNLIGMESRIPAEGVHHWAVYTNSAPLPDNPGPYDCENMGVTWGLVNGGGAGTEPGSFPEGTAMKLQAGSHIVFQLHMINTRGTPLDVPPAHMNLVAAAPGEDLQNVGLLIAGTLDITVPAQSSGVAVSGGCTLASPLQNIFAVFPHMHQLGRRITAEVTPKGGGPAVMISDVQWDFKDQGVYDVKGSAAEGDALTITCHYDNPNPKDVYFGLSSNNEMCVAVFYHYPAPETTSNVYCGIQ
jgi:hypothetical protein